MGIIVVVVLAVFGWLAYRYLSQGNLDTLKQDLLGSSQSPEDILKRRLAEGKINEKEYDRIRRTLGS